VKVDLDTAIAAGALAQRIKDRQVKIAMIESMMGEKWCISAIAALAPTGRQESLILDILDPDTSQKALGFALQVYAGQIEALQAELAAL
jgi:hypothetical protein